jgi:hypothetical protein
MTSSAQLQREADAARVGLADTLGQLRDGMAPSALSTEVIATFQGRLRRWRRRHVRASRA